MTRLLRAGVVQAKLAVGQPGDSDENEADRAAERAVGGKRTAVIRRKCSCGGNCSKCSTEEDERPVPRLQMFSMSRRIQRAAKNEDAKPQAEVAENDRRSPTLGLIVEDDAPISSRGQMKKSAFFDLLEGVVCATADAELAVAGRNSQSCPYIAKWIAFYRLQNSTYIERSLLKYAPEAADATTARDYVRAVRNRVRRAVAIWAKTGRVIGIPEGVQVTPPEREKAEGKAGSAKGSDARKSKTDEGFGTGLLRAISGARRTQFKEQEGTTPQATDAESVRSQLGHGRTLDSSTRGRMESAFGSDFSSVRVHDDSGAWGLSSQLNARAFTVGNNVAFGVGEYKPGTLVGDALIAHELAHVVQQGAATQSNAPMLKGDGDYDALEADADVSAVGAVALLWTGAKGKLADIGKNVSPALKSGLKLQRCSDAKLALSGVKINLEVSPQDESLMESLEGLETTVYPLYRDWRAAIDASISSAGMTSVAQGTQGEFIDTSGFSSNLNLLLMRDAEQRLKDALAAEGMPADADAFWRKVSSFENFFENYTTNDGFKILEENEKLVQGEIKHYSGDPATGEVAALKAALVPYNDRIRQRIEHLKSLSGMGGYSPPSDMDIDMVVMSIDDKARKALVSRFPIVADKTFNLRRFAAESDPKKQQELLLKKAGERISDIQKTRANLQDKPSRAWQFDLAMARARRDLHIREGSIFDLIIQDRLKRDKEEEFFKNALIGALAIGLGLLSFGEGTVAVLAAAGTAGISAGVAIAHIEEYEVESAAHGTAFDQAAAISSHDPSLFWLALDVVFAIADLGAAFRAFAALRTVAKEVKVASDVEKLRAPAETFAKADEKIAKQAAPVVDKIVEGAKKHFSRQEFIAAAEKADEAAVKAVRAVVKDEAAISGLLHIEGGTRAKLLAAFADSPGVLQRLGRYVDESKQFASTVEHLSATFPPQQFKAILAKYMLTRSEQAPYILRALADAGATEADFKAIADALATTRSTRQVGPKFATQAIDKIADRLPAGQKGIADLRQATAGLHPNQSGTIFEKWAAKNIFGRAQKRFVSETKSLVEKFKSLKPKFHDSKLVLDDMRSLENNRAAILEYKHYQTAGAFGEEALSQIDDMAELIRIGATNEKGEVFSSVEYLFSTREAAVKNEAVIKEVLGDKVTIFFVDDTGTAVKLTAAGVK